MGLKDLFITSDENKEVKPKKTSPSKEVKFPNSDNSFFGNVGATNSNTQPQATNSQISSEHVAKFTEMYQKGFESLNQNGYDFYEFLQAVSHGGVDNPQIYSMAMIMGKGMDSSISKEKLLSQAESYINEIMKFYNQQVSSGQSKKQEFLTQKENENRLLSSELENLRGQLNAIQEQINDRSNKLSVIDSKYQPKIADIESKLLANEFAKNKIISLIESVKNGINNNLK